MANEITAQLWHNRILQLFQIWIGFLLIVMAHFLLSQDAILDRPSGILITLVLILGSYIVFNDKLIEIETTTTKK